MRCALFLALLLALAPLPGATLAEETELFAPAGQAQAEADAAEAALLAPGAYGAGIAALERARRDYRGGSARAEVDARLAEARESLVRAARSADEARRTFAAQLRQREAARTAEAFRLAGPTWVKAESQLADAARRLEKTDVEAALKRAGEAGALYDQAELQAIKATLLTEARALVVGLGPAGTQKLAPRTTERARALLEQAEAELDTDRTRVGAAGRLAAESAAEARHAMALAAFLQEARESKATPEDLVLEWESGLGRMAATLGAEANLAQGPRQATDGVVAAAATLSQRADDLAKELGQRNRQVISLEEEIRELDERLAGASTEARSLGERLAARERAREKFARVEQAFPPDQAVVFRQGEDIIVRVQGLAFAPGSAKLGTDASPLLDKLRDVVALYPRGIFTVEGHTDSSGDSAANQRLSQARAEAVRSYMLERLQVSAGRVTAVGYGDARPVAKNESSEGRRLNRRIDLVISPREDTAP